MLDIGWLELVVIGIVALIVVGPKDLPVMVRSAGQFMGKARAMAREFQRSMEDAAKESGLSDSAKQLGQLNSALNTKLNLNTATKAARSYADGIVKDIDPTADLAAAESGSATPKPEERPAPAAPQPAAPAAPQPAAATKDEAGAEARNEIGPRP